MTSTRGPSRGYHPNGCPDQFLGRGTTTLQEFIDRFVRLFDPSEVVRLNPDLVGVTFTEDTWIRVPYDPRRDCTDATPSPTPVWQLNDPTPPWMEAYADATPLPPVATPVR